MSDIVIPNAWEPLEHQTSLWQYMSEGGLRACVVWHRRAGKDSTVLNMTCDRMFDRIGTYWHMLPEKEQARKAVWNGIDKQGRRIIDQVFPQAMRAKTIDDEMRIEARNGSMWQVVGSDNYNSLIGANPVGVVFSEYSVGNPAAWDFIRPILAENGGWAVFIYTPRGRNHGKKLYDMALKNKDWFVEYLTVDDTLVISPAVIQAEIDSGMDDDMVQQEFFCSWAGVQQGSIYGNAMSLMRTQGRIGKYPYDRRYPVQTFWDIGHRDATSVVCHQQIGAFDRFIHAYESGGQDVSHFVSHLKSLPYVYGAHYLPHDAKNVTLAAKSNQLGKNVWDQMYALGMRDLKLVPRTRDQWVAINATRLRLDTVQIDETGCEHMIEAMESYHKKWDEVRRCYNNEPVHDWSSNYCDAVRGWAQGFSGQGITSSSFTRPDALRGGGNSFTMPAIVKSIGNRRTGY